MNQVSETSRSRLLKTLAVIGFLVLIIFGTWLAIQVVRLIPSAFSSLASLAENVEEGRQAQNNITIAVDSSVVNSGEATTVQWSEVKRPGYYTFSYDCVEGAAADLRINGEVTSLDCDTPFVIPEDTYELDLLFTAERNRFTDIAYHISFTEDNSDEPLVTSDKLATVINASIPQGVVLGETDDEVDDGPDTNDTGVDATDEAPAPAPSPAPRPAPQPTGLRYVKTYKVPVSDPNGYTELAVKYLGVGVLTSRDTFVRKAELDTSDKAAFQFEVKNIGTKTSTDWEFEAELTSGNTFESKTQSPLKPNERSVLTIAFDNPGEEGFQAFGAEISGGNDQSQSNNSFAWGVHVTD